MFLRCPGDSFQPVTNCPVNSSVENPFDRNAVAVWVGGQRIGKLPDDEASMLRPGLIRLQRQHGRAVALPGHVGGDHADGLGVYLSYDADAFGVRQRT